MALSVLSASALRRVSHAWLVVHHSRIVSPSRSQPDLLFSFSVHFFRHHFFSRVFVSALHVPSQSTTTARGATMGSPARASLTELQYCVHGSCATLTLTSMSEDSTSFPISGNGVLSRRASEKDFLRRAAASDTLAVPESKSDAPLGPSEAPHIPARWRSLVVARVVDTMCERGTWDVTGSRVVGPARGGPQTRVRARQTAGRA